MHVPFFHASSGGGKNVFSMRLPRQCLGPPEPEYVRARIGICVLDGGCGAAMTDGVGVGLGPRTPSSLQLLLALGV